jgi:hypothetical protein
MLQTCDVGLLMLDVALNTDCNTVTTWVAWVLCQGGGGRRLPDVGCCTPHAHNIARWTIYLTADG